MNTWKKEVTFNNAFDLLQSRLERRHLLTGSPALDSLLGGIEQGSFYVFYGEDGGAPDEIIFRLIVNSLNPSFQGESNKAFYLNCGNYKRSRTILDVDFLFRRMEEIGLDVSEATKRIYTVCAFSEMQQLKSADEIEKTVREDPKIKIIGVQQIAKLFMPALIMPREETMPNFQNFISRMKRLCVENNIVLAASCRQSAQNEMGVLMPEGGEFLKHEANVMVKLRRVKGAQFSAYVLKHPDRNRQGLRVDFQDGGNVGRITPSIRQRLVESMDSLRRTYRMAFKDEARKAAFDELWKAWASEEGVIIYSDLATVMDLLAITAAVDNRKAIEELRTEIKKVKRDIG